MADMRLPSIAEILNATEVLSSQSGAKVVKVRDAFVVKYGGRVSSTEAETVRYVSANSDVPLGTMTDPDNAKIKYIVMEFVEGQCLDEIWSNLSVVEREEVKTQLKDAVKACDSCRTKATSAQSTIENASMAYLLQVGPKDPM